MARATRNSKAAPALSSPPARRTRSKLKEKDAASSSNNPTSSSSQPVQDAPLTTDSGPAAAQKAPATKKSTGKTKSSTASKASAVTEKPSVPTSTATASSSKASAPATRTLAKNNNTTSEDSDNTASASKVTNKRSRRQPTVDRNTKKVTKSRARKPTTKASATTRKALEQHIEQEEAAPTPARTGPVRRTRAALKAGIASPLTPVSDNLNAKARQARSKKKLKDATPLSIIEDENDPKDPDDWFAEVQQEPRIYRDPGASMEEISEREDTTAAENDDIMEHETASSDADEAMGGDVEMVAEETENDASETEEDMADEEMERPQTPEEAPQQLQPPTTARSFGIANLFFNPLMSVKKLWSRTPAPVEPQSPLAMSPESPTVASPSNAAQERRTRNRNVRYTPREKNADKRHELSEKNKEAQRVEELQAQLRERDRQLAEFRRQSEVQELKQQKEAEQVPGQKRRRSSPTVIPARRPGEKGSFGMLDEYFNYDEPAPDTSSNRAKRRRTTMPSPDDEDTDDEYDFVQFPTEHTPPSLKRPRNGYRMAAMKDGQEDPMVANHELRVMHQENSFSQSYSFSQGLFTDTLSYWFPPKTSPQTKKSSPSAVYTGMFMAMPGDSGYRPENIFKKSEQQLRQQSSPKKDSKMDAAELKARAEEIVKKEKNGEEITEDERQLLEKAQRKFGHIAGSGSFSAPEYDSDDSSIMSDDLEESTSPRRNPAASTPPSAKAPSAKAPSTKSPSTKSPSTKSPSTKSPSTKSPSAKAPSAKAPSAKAPSAKASATEDSATEPPKSDSMKPPPPPMPAHAQLPQTMPAANDNIISKTPAGIPGATPKAGHNAALARQRELAEKHKPKTGSRLQYVSGVSSSPGASSPIVENNMESSLITQGMSTPASNVDTNSFSVYDALTEEAREKFGSLAEILNSEETKYAIWLEQNEVGNENESKEFAEYDHGFETAVTHAGSFPGAEDEGENERRERDEKEFAEYECEVKKLRGF